jgi:hypothetical protein
MKLTATIALPAILWGGACAAPFAEMQSARLAGLGVAEITPIYSYVDITGEGETVKVQDTYGVHVSTGVTPRMDLRLRVDHIRVSTRDLAEDFTATAVGIGPKFSLLPDQLALYLPIGLAFGHDLTTSKTLEFHPSVIGTLPLHEFAEMNASFKLLVPLNRDDGEDSGGNEIFTALNLGLGLSPELSRWVIRPEIGFLKNPGEDGTLRHFSLGVTIFTGR